jgi:hypothetical protein
MAVDYMEVLGVLGSLAAKHPQTTALLLQSYNLWNARADEINKITGEYQNAAAKAAGPLDQVAILMQLVALHPNVVGLLKQTLTMWQTRIPDLLDVIEELQSAAVSAAKT